MFKPDWLRPCPIDIPLISGLNFLRMSECKRKTGEILTVAKTKFCCLSWSKCAIHWRWSAQLAGKAAAGLTGQCGDSLEILVSSDAWEWRTKWMSDHISQQVWQECTVCIQLEDNLPPPRHASGFDEQLHQALCFCTKASLQADVLFDDDNIDTFYNMVVFKTPSACALVWGEWPSCPALPLWSLPKRPPL